MTTLATQTDDLRVLPKYDKKKKKFISSWLSPGSETFGNVYQSARLAGYSDNYSRQLTANSKGVEWIKDVKQLLTNLQPEHIYLAMQDIAIKGKQDRDKLRALELMAKVQGMFVDRSIQQVNVQFTNSVPRPVTEVDSTVAPDNVRPND